MKLITLLNWERDGFMQSNPEFFEMELIYEHHDCRPFTLSHMFGNDWDELLPIENWDIETSPSNTRKL